jgi:hypothetical protein
MNSFKRFSRMFLGFSLLTTGSIIGGACSVKLSGDFAAEAADLTDEHNDFAGGGTGGGATTGGSTSGVLVPPVADAAKASTFTYLCGDGCMSDDKSKVCPLPINPDNPPSTSCQIVPTAIGPTAECLTPGLLQEGEPCEKAANCAASLGCVRMGSDVGVCRAYCCGDIEACAPGTYCTLGAMTEDVMNTAPMHIPVCAPATPCTLLDDTTCNPGLTCTLVRKDGTTSCVEPGLGKQGDACPCSAGQVCVLSSGTCRTLCHLGGSDCPNEMLCQGGSEGFPDGIGVCVK